MHVFVCVCCVGGVCCVCCVGGVCCVVGGGADGKKSDMRNGIPRMSHKKEWKIIIYTQKLALLPTGLSGG